MRSSLLIILFLLISACSGDENGTDLPADPEELKLIFVFIGDQSLLSSETNSNIPVGEPIEIKFTLPVDIQSALDNISLMKGSTEVALSIEFKDNNKFLVITPEEITESTSYELKIADQLIGANGEEFNGLQAPFTTLTQPVLIEALAVDGIAVNPALKTLDISRSPVIQLHFNMPVTTAQLSSNSTFKLGAESVGSTISQVDESTITFEPTETLDGYRNYQLNISQNLGDDLDRPFDGLNFSFYTELDSTVKFEEISDDELLTKVQEQTFKYFWDFAHPTSGLARERNTSGNLVTSGGSGFGIMAIIVGIERGFITRQAGIDRMETIVDFLGSADRFHGAWSHWLDGNTGDVIPFSANDDGGDLVETAFMIQGLLTARQYLNASNGQEAGIITKINNLWESVEWDWYTQDGQDVLYWHWSPNFGWEKNHKITGWNESLIVYVLAASSPTHTIDAEVYSNGWSRNGAMVNSGNNSYYGHTLPLRSDLGGPLFFSHYSFLGLDPRNLSDEFANYWEQNVNHSLINHAYCEDNPQGFVGYKDYSWGLTASDGFSGYSAHSPNNDRGVITPTAALSSFPYTPEESMKALKHFYYILGDRLWGEYGFYDAFDLTNNWTASSYLAIDQGPIIIMMENYRTGLLWDLFMSAPEVKDGLTKLDISYE